MPSNLPRISVRIERVKIEKLKKIAAADGRSLNNDICKLLNRYIEQYEKRHGEIKID